MVNKASVSNTLDADIHKKLTDTMHEQNAALLNVKTGRF
jgi:hypothetical protein